MPARYVLDAHAWAEYLRGSPPGKRVKELVDSGQVYTTAATLAEVVAHVEKEGADSALAARAVQTLSEIIEIDSDLAIAAADRYARMSKSDPQATMSQAYLIEAAKKTGAEIVSGDRKLKSGRIIFIL
jgi:predicted nucleic acid-binding protein